MLAHQDSTGVWTIDDDLVADLAPVEAVINGLGPGRFPFFSERTH